MVTGWQTIDGAWQYFDGEGHMATGLIEVSGVKYYLNPDNGHMVANTTVTIGDVTYQADGSGALSVVTPEGTQESAEAQNPQETPDPSSGTTQNPDMTGGPGVQR